MNRLSKFAYLFLGSLLVLIGYGSYHAYQWKQNVDQRGYAAEQTYLFLSQTVGHDDKGQPVSRAAVLNALTSQVVQK